ncbi:hypothetical protein EZN00_03033 [Clostridium tyrobutyricum]|nr:hypothetical protein EZN00_03033 [Clostridium tyrobutyricum]
MSRKCGGYDSGRKCGSGKEVLVIIIILILFCGVSC